MKEHYDFAFSFASENRTIVEQIKNKMQGFTIFYDQDFQSELCGKDLYSYLRYIYMHQATYVVCFLSRYYSQKVWTNLEFTAIKDRFLSTFFASDFLIPIVLEEEAFLEDIPSFIGYHKYKDVDNVVSLLKEKIEKSLNEDFYLDSISNFRDSLLHKIVSNLNMNRHKSTCNEDELTFICNETEQMVYLLPDHFANLPCLLLYENKKSDLPLAIITWKRTHLIRFTFSAFTDLSRNTYEELSFNELAKKIEEYLLFGER